MQKAVATNTPNYTDKYTSKYHVNNFYKWGKRRTDLGEGWLWSHTLVMKPLVMFSIDGEKIRKKEEYF